MAGLFNGNWIPFQDAVGRQGWYNQQTGQTTYQMYNMYNSTSPMMNPMQNMQQMYQPQVPVAPMGYVQPQVQQGTLVGWQATTDRQGRRYYFNPVTGQQLYY